MNALETAKLMLSQVATALDETMLPDVAFVGGCTTGLWVTDEFSRQSIRFTDDVDLIVSVIGKSGWYKLRDRLIDAGFHESKDDVSCRMRLDDLKVDFMPDDEDVLGFSNLWYKDALHTAMPYKLQENLVINVVTPPLLIATKLEAFKGRGNNDPLSSRDVEDILTLFDGRPELNEEIRNSPVELVEYLVLELRQLASIPNFDYAAQSTARNDIDREQLLMQRISSICGEGIQKSD